MAASATTGRSRGRPRDEELLERRRREIIEVASRHFAKTGYSPTDIQVVADELGVGKGTIYRYFPSKEILFLSSVDYGMQQLKAAIDRATAKAGDALECVESGVRAYLGYFNRHPELIELVVQERCHFRDRKRSTYFVHQDANMGPWSSLFEAMIRDGLIRDVPVQRITQVISDLLYGTIFTNHFAGRKKSLRSQCDDVLDVLFNGLLTQERRGTRA